MRSLVKVIDEICDVAPDLKIELASIRSSVEYAAPESMTYWWRATARALNDYAANHSRREEIDRIFSGKRKEAV